jgi:hypothetical protein
MLEMKAILLCERGAPASDFFQICCGILWYCRNVINVSGGTWKAIWSSEDKPLFVSLAMISLVVTSRRTVIWVKRQKKNCSSADRSNHVRACSECTCRLQSSASQTFALRKFNVFTNMFVRQIYFWAFRDDEGKAYSSGTRALAFHEAYVHFRSARPPS